MRKLISVAIIRGGRIVGVSTVYVIPVFILIDTTN